MGLVNINVKVIPHHTQRYETIGDWYFTDRGQTLNVFVSELGNNEMEFLVAFHEQAEAMLCKSRGISEPAITEFDKLFEARREAGNTDEPGDDPMAPYKREHFFSTSIERLMAAELKIDWRKYEEAVNSL